MQGKGLGKVGPCEAEKENLLNTFFLDSLLAVCNQPSAALSQLCLCSPTSCPYTYDFACKFLIFIKTSVILTQGLPKDSSLLDMCARTPIFKIFYILRI